MDKAPIAGGHTNVYGTAPGQEVAYPPGGFPSAPPPQVMGGGMMPVAGADPTLLAGSSGKLVIKEKVNKAEAIASAVGCCWNQANTYEVFDEMTGQKVLHVKEHSGLCCRLFCKPYHSLKLNLTDPRTGYHVMTIDRPYKCHTICPAICNMCQQQAYLYVGSDTKNHAALLGYAKAPRCAGCFTPTIGVHLSNHEVPFSYIEGPACCFGGCSEMCCDQPFPISQHRGKSQDMGLLVKEKPENASEALKEVMTDADLYTLTFHNPSLTPQQRTVLLSSALLLDYLFFETGKPWQCSPFTRTCSITCCNFYMCGMLWPCKLVLGGRRHNHE
eukprot:TRINITY_DN20333_c0_g1_i1.p1 TRINITY_DN20333_c0_g1~~TRINITY_DN20333_c0_g1_i1.p1  ORF type:complete len:329 (+),score=62.96 TRINITY_DN20333_c0_g1_i1:39-1025(+)